MSNEQDQYYDDLQELISQFLERLDELPTPENLDVEDPAYLAVVMLVERMVDERESCATCLSHDLFDVLLRLVAEQGHHGDDASPGEHDHLH